jgi:hypothetical protein
VAITTPDANAGPTMIVTHTTVRVFTAILTADVIADKPPGKNPIEFETYNFTLRF